MSDPKPIRLSVDPGVPDEAVIETAVRVLVAGELVAYPTDTLYGLGIDPTQPDAVERLFQAKGRPRELAVPLIAADTEQVEQHAGSLTPLAHRLAEQFWPGPMTLVVTAVPSLSRRLLAGGDTVAVRVPDHLVARALARRLGRPLTATSANRSGESAPSTAAATVAGLGSLVSLVVDAGPTPGAEPSTIVDVRTDTPVLLRSGIIPWDRVVTLKN